MVPTILPVLLIFFFANLLIKKTIIAITKIRINSGKKINKSDLVYSPLSNP